MVCNPTPAVAPINLFEFAAIPFPVQIPPKGRPLLNRSVSL